MKNPIDYLDKELNKIFDNLNQNWVKVSSILSKLDLSFLVKEITRRELQFTSESLLKLYLWKRIRGIKYHSKVLKQLTENQDGAFDLGFTKDDKGIINIPKKRTLNEFLQFKVRKEVRELLDIIAQKIIAIATKKGIILDLKIVKEEIKRHNNRVEQRKRLKEATKLVKKLVYPQIQIKLRHNAKFTIKDLLDVLVHIAYSHDFTTNGSNTFQELNKDKQAPSGDLMLYHFSKLQSVDNINEMFISIFDIIFNFAKQNYKLLNIRKVNIAYDIHKIPYYGDKNDPYIVEGKPDRGTTHFYQFLTCSIVIARQKFAIDAIPVHKFDRIQDLLNKSLLRVKNKLHIDKAYFDRGFDKPNIINVIKSHNVKFIIPKIRNPLIKVWMKKSEDCNARIINDFEIGKNEKTIVNLILVDDDEGIKRAFITNFDIPIQLSHYLYSWYSKRWGIETAYRQFDHDFKARTTSKNYHIRLFYFLFSVCLYNLWILVNICVSLTLYGRLSDKPIITAKLFAVVLYRVSYEDPPT